MKEMILSIAAMLAIIVLAFWAALHIPCKWFALEGAGSVPARCISEFVK